MRVLVTGHRGYIGSVLVDRLKAAGHEVTGVDTKLYEDCTFGGAQRQRDPDDQSGFGLANATLTASSPRSTVASSDWLCARGGVYTRQSRSEAHRRVFWPLSRHTAEPLPTTGDFCTAGEGSAEPIAAARSMRPRFMALFPVFRGAACPPPGNASRRS
jgi:NAD dependent epimerase/dehydratase family